MFQKFKIEVAKTVKKGEKLSTGKTATDNVREKVGEVFASVPLMDELRKITAAAEQAVATDDKGNPIMGTDGKPTLAVDEKYGLPVYNSDEANWVFSAVIAAVMMQARNKLVSGTAQLKAEAVIAEDWAGLTADGGTGNGAALAALRDCQAAFNAYVATLGKSEATAKMLIVYFKSREALSVQSPATKAKMVEYVETFAVSLSESDQERFEKPIQRVLETCSEVTDSTGGLD